MNDSLTAAPPQKLADLLSAATLLLQAGRPADAIAPLRDAAQLQPYNASLLHDLGLAYLESGLHAEAITALQRAVSCDPRYADAYFRLGIALEKQGDMRGAVLAYDRATQLRPALTEAWFRAGALVYLMGHRNEAIGCFRRAAATGPNTSFGRLGKARALLTEDRNPEAEQVLRSTLARDPGNAMAYDLLGNLLTEYGRFEEARSCFVRAIELAPMLAGCYYELVRCRPVTAADADLVQQMEAALDTPGLEAAQLLRVHLALGKAADDLGDYALAMQHLDAADALRRKTLKLDPEAFSKHVDRIIARCTPEFLSQAQHLGNNSPLPVLILGMPRSGTTLVEQIVSMHPQAAGADELHFWNDRGTSWLGAGAVGNKAPFLAEAAFDYLGLLRSIAPKAARITDKMPFNFLWAGLIHAAFPNATILHCRRSPIDTALSIHQTHFHPYLAFPTGGVELVEYYRSYERLMAYWRSVLPSDRFLEVDYEELTEAPEPQIRRIISACQLEWDGACLQPERNTRAVRTPSKWQARQPIYRTSVARWRRYQPWLGPLGALAPESLGQEP